MAPEVCVRREVELPASLVRIVDGMAQRDSMSFADMVRRALEREVGISVCVDTPTGSQGDLISIAEVCQKLKISVWTARRRAGKKGHPLRLARSRIGKQKPMHFLRSRIEQMERGE